MEARLDAVSWQLLVLLQQEGRLSYAELARRVGMSLPAVAERVKRLEEAGVIQGYRAEVSLERLGLGLTVFIELKTPASRYQPFLKLAREMPEIRECHHVTGSGAFVIRAVVEKIQALEPVIEQLSQFGETRTSIVMSSPIEKRVFTPREGGE